jgi:hypothetical protein
MTSITTELSLLSEDSAVPRPSNWITALFVAELVMVPFFLFLTVWHGRRIRLVWKLVGKRDFLLLFHANYLLYGPMMALYFGFNGTCGLWNRYAPEPGYQFGPGLCSNKDLILVSNYLESSANFLQVALMAVVIYYARKEIGYVRIGHWEWEASTQRKVWKLVAVILIVCGIETLYVPSPGHLFLNILPRAYLFLVTFMAFTQVILLTRLVDLTERVIPLASPKPLVLLTSIRMVIVLLKGAAAICAFLDCSGFTMLKAMCLITAVVLHSFTPRCLFALLISSGPGSSVVSLKTLPSTRFC